MSEHAESLRPPRSSSTRTRVAPSRRRASRKAAPSQPLRVAVFTTSYPRHSDDFAGRFVSDAVKRMRARGVEVKVVSPGTFRDFGLSSNGTGIVGAVKRRPWLAPLLFVSMVRALRRAASGADLVHAHWLWGGLVAAFSGKPFVVTLHGSLTAGSLNDFALCSRCPWLVRLVLRRARAVICVSESLANAVREAGVRNVVFVPNGIAVPKRVGAEAQPLEVLYAGRLTAEKGVSELAEACGDMNLVVAGDGPLRTVVPQALGFLGPRDLAHRYRNAAVVVCPSHVEGFGVVCAEAMAHGKPVVASATGGLANLVVDGETGILVPPGDVCALRDAVERLLGDPHLRQRFGAAGRKRIRTHYSWESVTAMTLAIYADVLPRPDTPPAAEPSISVG